MISSESTEDEMKNVLGGLLSGKMLAPSPTFQKALMGKYRNNEEEVTSFLTRDRGTKPAV